MCVEKFLDVVVEGDVVKVKVLFVDKLMGCVLLFIKDMLEGLWFNIFMKFC